MAWQTLEQKVGNLSEEKQRAYEQSVQNADLRVDAYLNREKEGQQKEQTGRFSEKELADAAKWISRMKSLGLDYDAKIADSPIYFNSEHKERGARERKALKDAALQYMGDVMAYEKDYIGKFQQDTGVVLDREKTAEEQEKERQKREKIAEISSSKEASKNYNASLADENLKMKQRVLFGINNEGVSRSIMERMREVEKKRLRANKVISMITQGRWRKPEEFSPKTQDTLTEAYNQLLEVKALQQELREEIRKNTLADYANEKEETMAKAEAAAYMHGVSRFMEEQRMELQEAEKAFEEEQLLSKRPYTLLHLKETREAKKKEYLQVFIDGQTLRYANEELREQNLIERNLTVEEADEIIGEYLDDVYKQPNSYQIRVPNCDILGKILESGRFRTQIETKKSFGGTNAVESRKEFTQSKFGSDKNLLPDKEYEVYGYLSHGDLVKECRNGVQTNKVGNGIGQYGQIIVTLKKDRMKYRTTTTDADSLDAWQSAHPVLMEDKKDSACVKTMSKGVVLEEAVKYKQRKERGEDVSDMLTIDNLLTAGENGYVELQFHGGVTLEDIESITLNTNYVSDNKNFAPDTDIPPELLDSLKRNGIKAYVVRGDKIEEK